LSVAVVTKPFAFEAAPDAAGRKQALQDLIGVVDTVIVIPRAVIETVERGTSFSMRFRCDDILPRPCRAFGHQITVPASSIATLPT